MKESIRITPADFKSLNPTLIMEDPALRISDASQYAVVAELIEAAEEAFRNYTNNVVCLSTWEKMIDSFPDNGDWIETIAPLYDVQWIKYLDTVGVEQTLASAVYSVDSSNPHIVGKIFLAANQTWPGTLSQVNAITIRFRAGYEDPNKIPPMIKRGLLWKIQELSRQRSLCSQHLLK